MDETDAVDEPVASAVDDGGYSLGDSLASPKTRARRSDRAQLCGLPSSWGNGNAASEEPGGTDQTRKCRSDGTFFSSDSGGRKRSPEQNAHFRRLGNPRQTRPLVDGSALASSENGTTWECSSDTRESERPGARDQEHILGARMQQAGSCRIQPETWRTLVGLHEKVPQPRRNSATGRWRSLSSVLRYQKASKLLSAMQLIEPRQAKFGRYCEDNLERLLDAPMEGRSSPGLDIDASLKSGMLRRV